MSRLNNLNLLLSFAVLTALSSTAILAQAPDQTPPAPIERSAPPPQQPAYRPGYNTHNNMRRAAPPTVKESSPAPGIILRVAANGSAQTVSSSNDAVELRIEHGKANVSVRDSRQNSQILVDLPGGQTALIKDGLYTFNADTNTVSVLIGEAKAFPGVKSDPKDKGITIKEDHQLAFTAVRPGTKLRSVDVGPYQVRADLLPGSGNHGDGPREAYPPYGYGYGAAPYGDGFYGYGYPYYAYGSPYGWGYPFGIGFGYGFYGGWGGGGFHGRR